MIFIAYSEVKVAAGLENCEEFGEKTREKSVTPSLRSAPDILSMGHVARVVDTYPRLRLTLPAFPYHEETDLRKTLHQKLKFGG